MGRPAARTFDRHICSMTGPAPHEGGYLVVTRVPNVFAGGRQVAAITDLAICKHGWPNSILLGSFTVFVNGLPAARRYDMTAHAGMILEGEPSVRIGKDTPAELLRLAILRIANSKYGESEKGKKTIAVLEKKLAEGTLTAENLPPNKSGEYAETDQDGDNRIGRWDKKGDIAVNDDYLDDVDATAVALVHEAKHDELDDDGENLRELEAHKEANKLYQEERNHGYENENHEKTREAIEKDSQMPDTADQRDANLRRLLEGREYEDKDM